MKRINGSHSEESSAVKKTRGITTGGHAKEGAKDRQMRSLESAKPTVETPIEEQKVSKRRGRPVLGTKEESQPIAVPRSQLQASGKQRKAAVGKENELDDAEVEKVVRRGRSSNTRAEVQAIFEQAVYQSRKSVENVNQGHETRNQPSQATAETVSSPKPKPQGRKKNEQPRGRRSGTVIEVVCIVSGFKIIHNAKCFIAGSRNICICENQQGTQEA